MEQQDFKAILDEPMVIALALKAIQLSDKERCDLVTLYSTDGGVITTRDSGNRLRGETVFTCSKVGRYLTDFFDGVRPTDTMMWIGFIEADRDGQEHWFMNPQIKGAMLANGWV